MKRVFILLSFVLVPSVFAGQRIEGGVGIGTSASSTYISTTPPSGGLLVQGNVGLGTLNPGVALDVVGTVRTTGLVAHGNVGISTTAPTTCGCKQYTDGLCTTLGPCT